MAKNLKNYTPQNNNNYSNNNNSGHPSNEEIERIKRNISPNDMSEVKKVTDKYKGKSQNEMFDDIIKMINAQRQSGNLSDSDLKSFTSRISPMLNDSQRKELKKLLDTVN